VLEPKLPATASMENLHEYPNHRDHQ